MSNPGPGPNAPAGNPAEALTAEARNATLNRVIWRLLPLLFFCYVIAYIDRINVGFAKLQLREVLGVSEEKFSSAYGFGAGLFFIGYFLFEVPSNLILQRVGARIWIARIMIVWGIISMGFLFLRGTTMFYAMRFLLGAAEAGFFPGVILYLTYWFPAQERARTVAMFIASPANPQGAVASRDYFTRLKQLADRFGFFILSDECYSEIYTREAPGSALECAGPDFANVIVFQSLSKRSNLPGMRVGFAAGDAKFLAAFHELRNVAAPQVPVPLQHVAVAAYGDEAHVEENRKLYRTKFDFADQILGSRYGYRRPAGGFCVWLDVSDRGGDEAACVRLFRDAGVRVIPGSYLARMQDDGSNPGAGYIRLALVSDSQSTAEALHRLVETLD